VEKRLARYQQKELKFGSHVTGQGEITAPRRELTHAVVHLLDNAFKFSPAGGRVHFAIEIGDNGGAVLTVENDGASIPQELREQVFQRYYQISQGDNREHDGLGVGLFIAREIFRSLGGDVTILDSTTGCCVQAILPDLRPEDTYYG
jgi:signal transduction histidine kinase